jgi:hypothetical protein
MEHAPSFRRRGVIARARLAWAARRRRLQKAVARRTQAGEAYILLAVVVPTLAVNDAAAETNWNVRRVEASTCLRADARSEAGHRAVSLEHSGALHSRRARQTFARSAGDGSQVVRAPPLQEDIMTVDPKPRTAENNGRL